MHASPNSLTNTTESSMVFHILIPQGLRTNSFFRLKRTCLCSRPLTWAFQKFSLVNCWLHSAQQSWPVFVYLKRIRNFVNYSLIFAQIYFASGESILFCFSCFINWRSVVLVFTGFDAIWKQWISFNINSVSETIYYNLGFSFQFGNNEAKKMNWQNATRFMRRRKKRKHTHTYAKWTEKKERMREITTTKMCSNQQRKK
jgi:hypothetical protein